MADKCFFYAIVDSVRNEFNNEKKQAIYSGVNFTDKTKQMKVEHLNLRITTHRLILSNHQNLDDVKENDNQFLYFIIMIKHIKEIQKRTRGIITKELDHINIVTEYGSIQLDGKHIEGILLQIIGAHEKKLWKIEEFKRPEEVQHMQSQYKGIRSEIIGRKQQIQDTQSTIKTSFDGDYEDLFKNSEELQKISQELRNNLKQGESNDDVNSILQQLGCFQIITKDESGDNYYQELAKQLCKLCQELFPRMGGIISLLDLYYYFNKKRTMSLLSPEEVIQACQLFQNINFPAKIVSYGGIKVIESTLYNPDQDFENTLGKYINYDNGISAEQLSKKLGISVMITKIKLQNAIKIGKVCIDKRLEGIRYFRNLIL